MASDDLHIPGWAWGLIASSGPVIWALLKQYFASMQMDRTLKAIHKRLDKIDARSEKLDMRVEEIE